MEYVGWSYFFVYKHFMRIILGSASPRRKELLGAMGYEFEVLTADIDESYPEELEKEAIAIYIAEQKAKALLPYLNTKTDLLICADTIVCLDNEVLGKPTGSEDAKSMIRKLSGKTHEVFTGVVIQNQEQKKSFFDRTAVTFKYLSDSEIDYYVDRFKPYDKAGSYGIQDWIGMVGVEKIEGSYTNVMGLPTSKLYEEMAVFNR
jgi:septum formation protein